MTEYLWTSDEESALRYMFVNGGSLQSMMVLCNKRAPVVLRKLVDMELLMQSKNTGLYHKVEAEPWIK